MKVSPEGTVSKSRERGFPFPDCKAFERDGRSVDLDRESFQAGREKELRGYLLILLTWLEPGWGHFSGDGRVFVG